MKQSYVKDPFGEAKPLYNAYNEAMTELFKKNDKIVFINQMRAKEADKFTRIFSHQSNSKMLDEFDHGFFAAWVDYAKALKVSSNF
jgi:hypothetical protein